MASEVENQADIDVSVRSLLRPYAAKIAEVMAKKTMDVGFQDIEQHLKATNSLLFKAAKNLDDPRKIESSVRQIIETSNNIRATKEAFQKTVSVTDRFYSQSENDDKKLLSETLEAHKGAIKAPSVESHDFWARYQQAVNGSGQNEDDVEIMLNDGETDSGAMEAKFKDPVSLEIMTRPMRNSVCKHVYDESTMEQVLNSNKRVCPVRGCKQMVHRNNMTPDENLLFDIEEWQKTQNRKKGGGKKKKTDQVQGPSKKNKRVMSDEEEED